MSLKSALLFIREERKRQAAGLTGVIGNSGSLAEVVGRARREGYSFEEEDLREAFKREWGMRWMIKFNTTDR